MRIRGATTLRAPAGEVWRALNDPAVLVRTIPGCEWLEATGPGSCRLTVTAGVASTQGIYTGEISVSDRLEPTSFLMTATGAGGPGTFSTRVRVSLVPTHDGSTDLTYDADATLTGLIAGVGQRMVSSVARKMASEFFTSLDDVLMGTAATPAAGPAPAAPVVAPDSAQPPVPAVAPPGPPAGGKAVPRAYLSARRAAATPAGRGFVRGVAVGAAVALAAVAAGGVLGRRGR